MAAAGIAGLAPLKTASALAGTADDRQYLELRHYQPLTGPNRSRLEDFLRDAALPAWNRLGITPVGVFSVAYGPNAPSLYVLLPHPTLDAVLSARDHLVADEAYQRDGATFLSATLADPAFVRMESRLLRAFSGMPRIEAPAREPRIFELRIYESHSESAARRKIEMFNEGGEIEIFRKTGLTPVFFGETIIGPLMPNLTYMITFENMEARDRQWDVFVNDPAWKTISSNPYYSGTVSNITDFILRPTGYSQI